MQPLKPGIGRLRRSAALGLRPGQHEIDEDAILLDRIVEQREAAIAMAEKPQHRRHPLDRVLHRRGRLDAGGA